MRERWRMVAVLPMNNADKAVSLVLGNRNDDYGHPGEDFRGVALMWSGLLAAKLAPGAQVTAEDVALLMVALKLRRHAHRPKEDNLVDAHGYLLCLEWIERNQRPAPMSEGGAR